jgi:hypothetical protein
MLVTLSKTVSPRVSTLRQVDRRIGIRGMSAGRGRYGPIPPSRDPLRALADDHIFVVAREPRRRAQVHGFRRNRDSLRFDFYFEFALLS